MQIEIETRYKTDIKVQKESETWPQAADPVYSLGLASEERVQKT